MLTEFQYKTAYNVSLAALSEAKGTLLAERGISVSEDPRTANPSLQLTGQAKTDVQMKKAAFEPSQNADAPVKPKTWNFSISIGWDKPLQIKGTVSAGQSPLVDGVAGGRFDSRQG